MNEVDYSLLAFLVACTLMLMIGYFEHDRDILNPISAFVIMELVLVGAVSAASCWYSTNIFDVSEEALVRAIWLHLIYGLAVVFSYLASRNPIRIFFSRILDFTSPSYISMGLRLLVEYALILGAIFAMLELIYTNPLGMLWLTNSREAYIGLRAGSGQWWVLYQMCIVLLFVATLFRRVERPHFLRLIKLILIFCTLMYFTGSKSAVLIIPIIAAIYIHFYIYQIRIFKLIILAILCFIGFAILLSEGGRIDILGGVLPYFSDYMAVTALNIEQADLQGHTLGYATLSSLWYWVPRALFTGKPYEWGTAFFNGSLFPGMAEQGHTPGVLLWITYYIDFGLIGVIFQGIFIGAFSRAVYMEFISRRDAGAFLLMIPFCFYIVPVSAGSSTLFILMALFLRKCYGIPEKKLSSINF